MDQTGSGFVRRGVLLGFFLSGVTGLVYQGIWIRMLTLVIGGTTAALTTVLIAFMGGLALGSLIFGGMADRVRNPLRAYAALELLIGGYALALPGLYDRVPTLYQALYEVDPSRGILFNLLRFVLALLFFGFPATLMGGTLPLIVRALSQGVRGLQVTVARIYAINTFGATIGAFLTGFVVIPTLGLTQTLVFTALTNLALGVLFWTLLGSRYVPVLVVAPRGGAGMPAISTASSPAPTVPLEPPGELRRPSAIPAIGAAVPDAPWEVAPLHEITLPLGAERLEPQPPPIHKPPAQRRLLLAFFLMGASSLSYEILWHRLLGLSFGSSVYAVSTMLTSFLLGIALGSWWLQRRPTGDEPSWASLGWIEVGIGVAAPLTGLALAFLPTLAQYLFLFPYIATQILGPDAAELGFWALQASMFLVGTLAMLVPTTLMGASFPLAVQLFAGREVGSSVGRVYAANTFGSIVGLAITGFVLIEWIGTRGSSTFWSLVNGGLGVVLLGAAMTKGQLEARPFRNLVGPATAVLFPLVFAPNWNPEVLTSGVYYHTLAARDALLQGEILFQTEDDLGLVSLHRTTEWDQPEPIHTLKFNGKFMGTDGARVRVQHLFAHLPIFMRGEGAKQALVIGLGGGYTVEAALQHPLRQIDAVEISRGIIEAAHLTRPTVFGDPRLRVYEEDVRSLILTSPERYDVIISETSDPWMTGVANLYTLEFFRWLRARLAPGGVFGTWLQVRHKRVGDVQTILKTMQAAFPHLAVFLVSEGDLVLVMSDAPLRLDAEFLRNRHAALRTELAAINLRSPWQLPAMLVLDPPSLERSVKDAPLNTDDLPVIEFRTPRSLNIGLRGEAVRDALFAEAPRELELELLHARPSDRVLWQAWRALHLQRYEEVETWLTRAIVLGAAPEPYLRAVAHFRAGRYAQALERARELPDDPRQALLVAGCLLHLGDVPGLTRHLRHDPSWPAAGDAWEARIHERRRLLLQALGVATGTSLPTQGESPSAP